MATLNINIPDDKVNDLIAAFGAVSQADAKQKIIDFIKRVYKNYKRQQVNEDIALT